MKIKWNFLGGGGGGCKTKDFPRGSIDIFWNCTLYMNANLTGLTHSGSVGMHTPAVHYCLK